MRAIILPAYLLAHLLLAPLAGASDAEWREYAKVIEQNPRQSMVDATQARDQAQARSDKTGLVRALRQRVLARCVAAGQNEQDNERDVDTGLGLAREIGDMDSVAWLLYEKAWIEFEAKGHHQAANMLLEQGIALAEQHNLQGTLAWLYLRKGEILSRIGHNSEAMNWLSTAYARFQTQQDVLGMAFALKFIMRMSLVEGASVEDKVKAIAYGKQALGLIDTEVYRATAGGLYNTLGTVYFSLGDLANAKQFLERALADSRAQGSVEATAEIQYKLARLAQEQRRFSDVLGHLDEATPIFEKLGRKRRIIQTLVTRAEVLAQLGRNQESLQALADARPILTQADSPEADVFYYEHAADLQAKFGNPQEAYRQMVALRKTEQRLAETANSTLSSELKVRFDVELKEKENALLRAKEQEAEARGLALTLALVLSLLLLSGIWFYLRKRAATARRDAEHQRALATAEAAANEAKRTFLANMSHELRSPLNVILGFTQLLQRNIDLPQDTQQDLAIVYKSGRHLHALINQVLDLSKIEAGRITLDEVDCDLYALLDELAEMFNMSAKQKGLRLIIDNSPDVPRHVRIDVLKLRQVLINLLNNALKFTSVGSVALHADAKMSEEHACLLSFAVTDTGPGIAQNELSELGSAFVQAQAGRLAKEGTGLGLAISSSFVRLMKGKFKLSSRLGEGTTIAFEIPAIVTESPVALPAVDAGSRVVALAPDQPHYRILVVDDLAESRQLLVRLLTPLGFEVHEAGNGKEALDIWEAWEPHLIYMDMRMPVMDGRQATRRIKATEKGKKTVVIALTASSLRERREQILADGCDDFMHKPFQEAMLFNMMQQHLGVQFVYDTEAIQVAVAPPDKTRMAALSVEMRTQLGDALKQLDIEATDHAIEAIAVHDAALAKALGELATQLDYERIFTLLENTENEAILSDKGAA